MNQPKVSILVPIYNTHEYLSQCLNSLIDQTLNDIEIICINDGSTDKSLDIINSFKNKDKRIKLLDKKNSGYGDSVNQGILVATGKYVGIIEADDFAENIMFEKLYNYAEKFGVPVAKSRFYWYWNDDNRIIDELNKKIPYNQCFNPKEHEDIFLLHASIWSAIYKKDFLKDICFLSTPGAAYQDMSFAFKVLAKTDIIYMTSEAFLNYRQNNVNSSVKQCGYDKLLLVDNEYAEIEKYLKEQGFYKHLLTIFNTSLLDRYLWNISRLDIDDCEKYVLHIQEKVKDVVDGTKFYSPKFSRRQLMMLSWIKKGNIKFIKAYTRLKRTFINKKR